MALGVPLSTAYGGGGGGGGGSRSTGMGRAAASQMSSRFYSEAPSSTTTTMPTMDPYVPTAPPAVPIPGKPQPVPETGPTTGTRDTYTTYDSDPNTGSSSWTPPPATPQPDPLAGLLGGDSSNATQTAMLQWLQSMIGQQNAQLGLTQQNLMGQAATGQAYQQFVAGQAGQQYGINSDRNGLDKWRANQTWDILSDELAGKSNTANATWGELQRNVGENRGFASRDRAIREWLNAQNVGFNTETRDNSIRDAQFAADRQGRARASSAVAAGATSSRGHRWDQRDILIERNNRADDARLNFRQVDAGLDAERRNITLGYDRTMESLLHQLNTGRISWQDALNGIEAARRSGALANDYANRSYGINQRQAGLTRDGAVTGSQLDLQRLLQQLAGQYITAQGGTYSNIGNLWGQFMGSGLWG